MLQRTGELGAGRTHLGRRACDVGALQRNLGLLDGCAVGAQRAQLDSCVPGQARRAETGRTPLPRVACRLKRGFETALGLALQWP